MSESDLFFASAVKRDSNVNALYQSLKKKILEKKGDPKVLEKYFFVDDDDKKAQCLV
jgi:hypothetical protein